MTQKLREILQSVLLNINSDGLCNLDEARQIEQAMSPLPWIVLEEENGD